MDFAFQNTLDVTSIFGEYFITKMLDKIFRLNLLKDSEMGDKENKKDYLKNLVQNHYILVYNWSHRIDFFGLNKPQMVESSTLELSITTNIRRFYGNAAKDSMLTESDILTSVENFLILGDPGAGKTTTLKRIAKKIITAQQADDKIAKKFPILIRLKDLQDGNRILNSICDTIGLKYRLVEVTNADKTKSYHKYYVGDLLIEDAVCQFLNESGVILILDGYDEIRTEIKEEITQEIDKISERQTSNSKMIISCRSGDFHKTLRYFSVCEICPLTMGQVLKIAHLWLEDTTDFFTQLEEKPYKELINRPLFLIQLLIIFNQAGGLPAVSSELYERIIFLLIRHWDNDRSIIRKSAYSNFDNESKQKFLEELSYILTYDIKTKVFNRRIFLDAYLKIYRDYNLPRTEGELIASEIESHNGLIVKSFGDQYEFSHLVLQEYLCARYLVTLPLNPRTLLKYLTEYPAPLAICVAISRKPSLWFGNFILKVLSKLSALDLNKANNSLFSFLERLIYEMPKFSNNCMEMGVALLLIISKFGYKASANGGIEYSTMFEVASKLLVFKNVSENIASALVFYGPDLGTRGESIKIIFYPPSDDYDNTMEYPKAMYLPRDFVQNYVTNHEYKLRHFKGAF